MRYAKLINGYLHYAPRTVTYNGMIVANPTDDMLTELGYLPVILSDSPPADEAHYAEPYWEQTGNGIMQKWEVKDNPVQYEGDLLSRVKELEQQVLTLKSDVQELKLASGGSVKPGGDIPFDPAPKPGTGGGFVPKPGGGLTIGG